MELAYFSHLECKICLKILQVHPTKIQISNSFKFCSIFQPGQLHNRRKLGKLKMSASQNILFLTKSFFFWTRFLPITCFRFLKKIRSSQNQKPTLEKKIVRKRKLRKPLQLFYLLGEVSLFLILYPLKAETVELLRVGKHCKAIQYNHNCTWTKMLQSKIYFGNHYQTAI